MNKEYIKMESTIVDFVGKKARTLIIQGCVPVDNVVDSVDTFKTPSVNLILTLE